MSRRVNRAVLAALLSILFITSLVGSTSVLANETVTLLDRGEPYDSMLVDNGTLWVGKSRKNFNSSYSLEAYSPDGKLLDAVTLSHSIATVKRVPEGGVMVTGINPDARLTEYTRASIKSGKISVSTKRIALGGFIYFWIGELGGRQYFVDQGGNPDDSGNLDQPAQTIFSSRGTDSKYLSTRVRMPVSGQVKDGKLLVVSSDGIGTTGARLVEIDPATAKSRIITQSKTAEYRNVEFIPGTSDVVMNALSENKLVIVDSVNGQIKREIETKGYTRSFDFIGSCVVAGNDETNTIEVFDLRSPDSAPKVALEVKLPANEFSGIRRISIDQATGVVFARANFACNPLTDRCADDNNRVIKFDLEAAAKIKSACK
jgi:hypothetical protein